MRAQLLGCAALSAAIAFCPLPANAQMLSASAAVFQSDSTGVRIHRLQRADRKDYPGWREGGRGHPGRYRRDRRDSSYVRGYYGNALGYYDDRSWEPDSGNGWWHDRPDRAFPRWMQNNRNCERQWWSGGGWTC